MAATNLSMHIPSQSHLSMLENRCTTIQDLKKIHAHFIKTGLSNHTLPISRVLAFAATSPAADINYAYSIFTRIHNPNIFMWNTIIRGFSQSSVPQNAILLFICMLSHSNVEPQRLTYPSLFKAYTQLGLPRSGAQLHGRVVKLGLGFDRFIRNTMIYMYANSGFLSEAYKMFDEEGDFDVVAWNSMIMGLAKTREIDEAMRLFDKMGLRRNDVSWNCMISGCVRNGKFVEAMTLFERMQEERIKASEFTLVSLLNSCANLGALEQGEWICDYILGKNRFKLNVIMVTSIVDMYSKCGAIDKARRFFEFAPIKGLSSWNSMILGLANNGCEEEAFELFYELISLKIEPNEVTFLGLLIACSYKGYVNQARDFFLLMKERYKIEPSVKHYSCMVDVLGQAGLLNEAEQLIKEMPMEPDAIIWGSLLSSCRKYGNVEMAIRAGRHINEINSNDSAAYILMSNVYAASGQFENAIRHRVLMKEKHVPKEKGCSSIEINGHVQEFGSAGKLNPDIQDLMFFLHSYNEEENLSIEEESM